MSICRTIFEKLFKKKTIPNIEMRPYPSKPIVFGVAKEDVHCGDLVSVSQDGKIGVSNYFAPPVDCSWLFRDKKPKPSLDERLNPHYRKYKAYLERCYG